MFSFRSPRPPTRHALLGPPHPHPHQYPCTQTNPNPNPTHTHNTHKHASIPFTPTPDSSPHLPQTHTHTLHSSPQPPPTPTHTPTPTPTLTPHTPHPHPPPHTLTHAPHTRALTERRVVLHDEPSRDVLHRQRCKTNNTQLQPHHNRVSESSSACNRNRCLNPQTCGAGVFVGAEAWRLRGEGNY